MTYDGIVIGGGAAGMFAAIMAARQGAKVLLLEKNERLGKKLLITGKGRCNVTNDCGPQEVLQNTPRNGRFLYSAMTAFPPEKAMAFFRELGCELKTERGNRVFPVTDRAQTVLDALLEAAAVEKVLADPAPFAALKSYDASSIGYVLRFWTKNADYWDTHFLVNRRVKELFDAKGVEMTYPHVNVHLDK